MFCFLIFVIIYLDSEEISRIFGQSPHGALRLAAGVAYFNAGLYLEATAHLLDALTPGRGAGSVDEAVRMLLVISRLRNDPALLTEVSTRTSRFFEDRHWYHKVMTEALYDTGYLDMAAEHASDWVKTVGTRPSGTKLNIQSQPNPWRALVQINLRRGGSEAALRAARDYVTASEQTAPARRAMADLLRKHRAHAQALLLYEEAADKDKSDRPSRLAAGEMALEVGDRPRARRHFDAALSTGDDKARSVRRVAEIYARQGYIEEAEALYASLDAFAMRGDRQRALMWLRQGRVDKARAAIDAAVAAAANPVVAQTRFAAIYLTDRNMPAALALTLADGALAKRSRSPHPVAQLVRAAALAELGRAPEAKRLLEQVLARGGADDLAVTAARGAFLGPGAAISRNLRLFAIKALAGRHSDLAKWALDQTVVAGSVRARFRAVDIIRNAFDHDAAWTGPHAQKLVDIAFSYLEPIRSRSGLVLALVDKVSALYERAGDLDAAVHVYMEALRRFPEQAHLHNNLAYLMARRDRALPEALERVRHAERLNPTGNDAYLDTEAWVLFKQGKYEEALAKVTFALRHMSLSKPASLAESYYHLGAILQKLGRADAARDALRRATRLDQGGVYGRKALKLLKVLALP